MRISDWSSDVCSSDLIGLTGGNINLALHQCHDESVAHKIAIEPRAPRRHNPAASRDDEWPSGIMSNIEAGLSPPHVDIPAPPALCKNENGIRLQPRYGALGQPHHTIHTTHPANKRKE